MNKSVPTVVLIRPEAASQRVRAALEARFGQRADVVVSAVLVIECCASAVDLSPYDGVVFTSENAVSCLATKAPPNGLRAYCVGRRTADIASRHGFTSFTSDGDFRKLIGLVEATSDRGRLLYPRGEHVANDLAGQVSNIDEVVVYRQVEQALSAEARRCLKGGPAVLPLYSARTASLASAQLGRVGTDIGVLAMSGAVAEAWGDAGGRIRVAKAPTGPAMIDLIVEELSADSAC